MAPRGIPDCDCDSVALYSVIVSDEFFLLRDPRTVEALPEDTMLDCFSWEIAAACTEALLGLLLIVPLRLRTGDGGGMSFFGGGVGGFVDVVDAVDMVDTVDLRATDFLEVAADAEEAVERSDVVEAAETALFAGIGASLLDSGEDDEDALPLMETFEAVDATRDRGTFGEDEVVAVAVVLTLLFDMVDTVDTRLDRGPLEGVASDLAVSKLVEPSLVVDTVDAGRERLEVGRRLELPTIVLRTVAVDRADLKDAAEDNG